MYVMIGLTLALAGIIAAGAAATSLALRVLRMKPRVASITSHPYLEIEWRERQAETLRELGVNLAALNVQVRSLAGSVARIMLAVRSIERVRRIAAVATEEALGLGVPWLRGLFAKKVAPGL